MRKLPTSARLHLYNLCSTKGTNHLLAGCLGKLHSHGVHSSGSWHANHIKRIDDAARIQLVAAAANLPHGCADGTGCHQQKIQQQQRRGKNPIDITSPVNLSLVVPMNGVDIRATALRSLQRMSACHVTTTAKVTRTSGLQTYHGIVGYRSNGDNESCTVCRINNGR